MKILIIEDDEAVASSLQKGLKNISYSVDVALTGKAGISLSSLNDYDVVVLDFYLPDISGQDVALQIKNKKPNLPIIVLSNEGDIKVKVSMLNLCDDYITKPFSLEELVARIKVVTRKDNKICDPNILSGSGIEMNLDSYVVKCNSEEVILSHKEFCLLKYFMENKNRALPRSLILEKVWDMNADPFTNTVDVHIQRLRKKIKPEGKKFIVTLASVGYKLVDDEYN